MPKAPNSEAGPDILLDDAPVVAPHVSKAKEKIEEPLFSVTVTKFGEGQVSTGKHVAGEGDVYAKRGEKLMVSKATADRLEKLGFAEAD